MQTIFNTYTGNAILNNALMTIEALGKLKDVSEITPNLLLNLYLEKELLNLNKRLKNYTMLFTKNGPLHNDKFKGEKIFDTLFKTIIESFESDGNKICEISGLRFQTTFNVVYENALTKAGLTKKEIVNKDTSLSRIWFPLIGGLGSDAQALPQAKFPIQIHPICIAILQFLPLSSLLYNGGILLIDSSNFNFAKRLIAENQKRLMKHIEVKKSNDQIENLRLAKGNYLLFALEILEDKEEIEEVYSDLNLWSFSNAGTGASCEIDRIPNTLIRKLIQIKRVSPSVGAELKDILMGELSFKFLDSLEKNQEWWLLYPNVFGSGKKRKEYQGVSPQFLEIYFKEIGFHKQIDYAKYLAYLIDKYKTTGFNKYLTKTDAWSVNEYRMDLYTILIEATKNQEWNLYHHLLILDNPDIIPIKNRFNSKHRLVHYFYQKRFFTKIPTLEKVTSNAKEVCEWFIALIQNDQNGKKIISNLINKQEYRKVNYTGLLERLCSKQNIEISLISKFLYDEHLNTKKIGLNELLRIFFSQPIQPLLPIKINLNLTFLADDNISQIEIAWYKKFDDFSIDYQKYFFEKYQNKNSGANPYQKYLNLIKDISFETSNFYYWFREALENLNQFIRKRDNLKTDKWSEEDLLFNFYGDYSPSFSKLAIKLSLIKNIHHTNQLNQKTTN